MAVAFARELRDGIPYECHKCVCATVSTVK